MEILQCLVQDVPGSNPTHSFFFLYHPVYILIVIINVRCSLIKKSEWSSGNTSMSCSRRSGFKSYSQFLLFVSACVHPVYILSVIINVRWRLIKKSEWSSGNTSMSCSRRSGFKSYSQFILFVSPCVHPVYILSAIINVRCSLIKKSEWSSGNNSLSCSRVPGFKSYSQFLLFVYACVHPVYILRVITSDAVWLRRVSGLVEIIHFLVLDVPGSNPTHSFFFLYLPVSILCTS